MANDSRSCLDIPNAVYLKKYYNGYHVKVITRKTLTVASQSYARCKSKSRFAKTTIRVKIAIFEPLKIRTDDALKG